MANEYTLQKLQDTQDKAVVKLTATFDGTGQEDQTRIDVSGLQYSLNTSGIIMSGNTDTRSLYQTYVTAFIYDVNIANGYLVLEWAGSVGDPGANTTMYTLHSGQHTVMLDDMRYPATITNPVAEADSANTTGDIRCRTVGASANDSYTVVLYMKKDARDYDKGQTADPVAFNRGPAAWS